MSLFWSIFSVVIALIIGFAAGLYVRRQHAESLERELADLKAAAAKTASAPEAAEEAPSAAKVAAKTAARPETKSPAPAATVAPPAPAPEAAAPEPEPAAAPTPQNGSGEPDDLKKISGVGPVLEEKLNKLGITRYSQIAAFTADEIARIDDELNFKGRIERDDWVGQAKALADNG